MKFVRDEKYCDLRLRKKLIKGFLMDDEYDNWGRDKKLSYEEEWLKELVKISF